MDLTVGDWLMIVTVVIGFVIQLVFVVWKASKVDSTVTSNKTELTGIIRALTARVEVQESHKTSERLAVIETSLDGIENSLKRIEALLDKQA